jgi:hypothetical protein
LLEIFSQVVVRRSSRSNHVETSISFNLVKRVNGPKFLDVGHHIVRISDRKLARNSWLGDGSKRFTAATRYIKKLLPSLALCKPDSLARCDGHAEIYHAYTMEKSGDIGAVTPDEVPAKLQATLNRKLKSANHI